MKVLEVLKKPVITEKSYKLMEDNKYLFFVEIKTNKTTIKKIFEEVFNVEVLSVNTLKYKAKKKRVGRFFGKKPAFKKAIIKLKPGQQLTAFQESSDLNSASEKPVVKQSFFQKLKKQFSNVKKVEETSAHQKQLSKVVNKKIKDVKIKNETS